MARVHAASIAPMTTGRQLSDGGCRTVSYAATRTTSDQSWTLAASGYSRAGALPEVTLATFGELSAP